MSILQRLAMWSLVVGASALLTLGWITTALAQVDSDGDSFHGDEAAMPIFLGVAVLGIILVLALQRRSPKPPQ